MNKIEDCMNAIGFVVLFAMLSLYDNIICAKFLKRNGFRKLEMEKRGSL